MRRGRRMSWPTPRRRLLPLAAPHAALSLLRLVRDIRRRSKGGGGGDDSCVRPFLRAHLRSRLLRENLRNLRAADVFCRERKTANPIQAAGEQENWLGLWRGLEPNVYRPGCALLGQTLRICASESSPKLGRRASSSSGTLPLDSCSAAKNTPHNLRPAIVATITPCLVH